MSRFGSPALMMEASEFRAVARHRLVAGSPATGAPHAALRAEPG